MSVEILHGDCIDAMRVMEAYSIDAIVTDPPYALGFMGKAWDSIGDTGRGSRTRSERAAEVTQQGIGHSTSAGPYLAAGIDSLRSAGTPFQAWCQQWATEALRLLKPGGHMLAFGGTRTSHRLVCGIEDAGFEIRDSIHWMYGSGFPKSHNLKGDWEGWGTALKPGHEPIILARKSLVGTVAANVVEHGTGAVNVDACRIEGADGTSNFPADRGHEETRQRQSAFAMTPGLAHDLGRWPANVILDEDAAAELDEGTGQLTSGGCPPRRNSDKFRNTFGAFKGTREQSGIGPSTGGASRFFYTAKASRADRGRGNDHPTVKPLSLMLWLVRLITPPGGTVLDPFMGSGTTLLAALEEGFSCIGIEQDAHYCDIARTRLLHAPVRLPMEEAI